MNTFYQRNIVLHLGWIVLKQKTVEAPLGASSLYRPQNESPK